MNVHFSLVCLSSVIKIFEFREACSADLCICGGFCILGKPIRAVEILIVSTGIHEEIQK